jgi:hypothetical protein
VLAQALAHRSGGEPPDLAALPDELESRAHQVSAARARSRGGRSGQKPRVFPGRSRT